MAFGLFVLTALQPLVILGDQLRQLPVRRIAAAAVAQRRPDEPLAMVGILKPSLHFYTDQVVLYEGVQANGPLNLDDRLQWERRPGQVSGVPLPGTSLLLVIDRSTAQLPHWRGLPHQPLAAFGLYQLWRVDRLALRRWAAAVGRSGAPAADWRRPRPERY